MPKKKRKVKRQAKTQKQTSVDTILKITAEELQNIIANALLQAEEQRKQIEKDKEEHERKEWREEIGYKDYSKSNSIFAKVRGALNNLKCGLKLLFMPSEKIKGYKTISSSLNMELSANYLIWGFLSLIFSIVIVIFTIANIVLNLIPWYVDILLFALAFCLFYNFLKSRLAYYEVMYIKDENLILNILASHNAKISMLISITSIAIALIALFKDIIYELF